MTRSSRAHGGREERLSRIGTALREAMSGLELARERAAKEHDLHPTDWRCLGYLDRLQAAVSPKAIISEMGLSSGSGTALLDRLEHAGYIERIPNPTDRRSILILLDRERAALPLARFRAIEEAYREVTKNLNDHDLMLIARFLEDTASVSRQIFDNIES